MISLDFLKFADCRWKKDKWPVLIQVRYKNDVASIHKWQVFVKYLWPVLIQIRYKNDVASIHKRQVFVKYLWCSTTPINIQSVNLQYPTVTPSERIEGYGQVRGHVFHFKSLLDIPNSNTVQHILEQVHREFSIILCIYWPNARHFPQSNSNNFVKYSKISSLLNLVDGNKCNKILDCKAVL